MTNRDRTKVRRSPQKQTHDPRAVEEILARAIIAHVAIVLDGQPFAIPVACAPYKQEILLHGSSASRLFKVLAEGDPACVTITNLHALVLAGSAFDSSMHYQSLMAFGAARVLEEDEKISALDALVDHLFPERRAELRPSTAKEIRATSVLAFPLTEISVKISNGFPDLPEENLGRDLWVGVLPITSTYRESLATPGLDPKVPVPSYISRWPINRI